MDAHAKSIDSVEVALGEALLSAGKLDGPAMERATRLAAAHGERLAAVLAKIGLVSERDLAFALAQVLDIPLADESGFTDVATPIDGISAKFLRHRPILPLSETADTIVVAMSDPLDSYACDALRLATGCALEIQVAEPAVIERVIERLYVDELGLKSSDLAAGIEAGEDIDVERLKDLASEAPVVQLVNSLITRAVEARASDIHIEPFEASFRARYRIDGLLQESMPLPGHLRAAVISRVKIMARLDIAERRLPQDGRVKTIVRGKSIDLRVSTMPTMHGESVVLRVLDRDSVELNFDALGVVDPARGQVEGSLAEPNGIFIVTGPTGSGKTTTLYAALCQINSPEKKLLTVEDPIEYQLDGVNQVQVKPSIGLSFANVLRSMLRQDPDIIMVGEIRDGETARIAAQAALTGHLVLSTLHTNDAASAVTRLVDMGVEDFLLASTLSGIAAQRLVRRLCPTCRAPHLAEDGIVDRFDLRRYVPDGPVTLYSAGGCDRCRGRGFLGRTVIMEVMRMTDRMRSLVLRQAAAKEMQRAAVEDGMRTMFDDGVFKALAGETTLEEVFRTTRDV
jgi:general secretion pathway protein E